MMTLTPVHPQDASTSLSNLFDNLRNGTADEDVSLELQEPLESWNPRMESVSVGIPNTVQPDQQSEGTAVDIPGPERLLEDAADPALRVAFRGANSTSVPATDTLSDLSQNSQAHAPDALLHATEFPPSDPEVDVACSDTSPFEEEACVQGLQLADEEGRDSAGLTEVERALVAQDPISEILCDVSGSNGLSDESKHDRMHLSHGADTWDAAGTEGSDSDGPPLASHRRHKPPRTRNSFRSPTPPLTPRSSADSTDRELTTALRRRKRLRRRKAMRRDSPVPETDNASEASTMARPNTVGDWRPVQCLVQRRTNGSHDVIAIQLPAIDLCATSGRGSTLSLLDVTSPTIPTKGAMCGSGQRVRYSQAEEERLVELKEQRYPKLSWEEIQEHLDQEDFPHRTTASLQVRYCTRLNSRLKSKRQTRRC